MDTILKTSFIILALSLNLGVLSMVKSYAQTRIVQGRVTVFEGIPVVNASVIVKSTKLSCSTDSSGFFSVGCDKKDVLKVIAHGFRNARVSLTPEDSVLSISLSFKTGDGYLRVAFDHGHILKRDQPNTQALFGMSGMASGEEENFDYSAFSSLEEAIMARFTSVRVVNGEVIIRGISTWALSNAALVVVDGVVRGYSIANIPPETVGSIEFLRGSDAASYGARGANGVVLIRTRRGDE